MAEAVFPDPLSPMTTVKLWPPLTIFQAFFQIIICDKTLIVVKTVFFFFEIAGHIEQLLQGSVDIVCP